MSTAFAIGLPIEFKRGPGLGGWQRGVVVSDDGGRILEIRPARGGEGVMVRRLHVRVPEHPEAPVRTAQTVEMAGIPRRVIVAPKPLLPLPKPCGRIFAPVYLAFVRFQPCCSCDTERGVQAHHQGPRPVGRKTDDYRTCPLCHRCHQHLHRTGLLLGRPELLTKEAVMAYLRGVMVDLLIEYFASGAEEPTAPPLSLDQRYLALVESLTTEAIADVA